MRCGELCKSCVGRCREIVSETQPIEIQCPVCEGDGCESCDGGTYRVSMCPASWIGSDMIGDIQIVAASENHLPVAGGLLDQSAWWFELHELLRREESRVQAEIDKRRFGK